MTGRLLNFFCEKRPCGHPKSSGLSPSNNELNSVSRIDRTTDFVLVVLRFPFAIRVTNVETHHIPTFRAKVCKQLLSTNEAPSRFVTQANLKGFPILAYSNVRNNLTAIAVGTFDLTHCLVLLGRDFSLHSCEGLVSSVFSPSATCWDNDASPSLDHSLSLEIRSNRASFQDAETSLNSNSISFRENRLIANIEVNSHWKKLMCPKQLSVRIVFSLVFASTFGIGLWYNGMSILIAVLGALAMWCIGVGTGCAILIARYLRNYPKENET